MRKVRVSRPVLGTVGVLALFATLLLVLWPEEDATPTVSPRTISPPPPPPTTRAKPPNPPDPTWLEAAREVLGAAARREACGPYLLLTDVTDRALLEACERLASGLDALYLERYGLAPRGEPAEAIFLFAEARDFRAFAQRDGRLPVGSAGYSNGAHGFTALDAGEQPLHPVLTTLAHELTHLVHRRALGVNLPPWLSEGLADGIGDTAATEGFLPLTGVRGSEPQAARLRTAYLRGEVRSLRRLTTLERGAFDREVPSFDYEQSALFVRFLLADAGLRPRFLAFLEEMSREGYEAERLAEALGVGWQALDLKFEQWLRAAGG